MKTQGVAFDLEGTVVDNEPAHHLAWIRAAKEIGVILNDPYDAMEKIPNFSGGPDDCIVNQIYDLVLVPGNMTPSPEERYRFLQRKWWHYDRLIKEVDLNPRPGFFEVYGRLKSKGLPVTIGTAVELERGLVLLKRSGLDRCFTLHEIVLLTDVKNPKPAPDCFLETARRMRIKPEEQLVFEDSPRGVKSGVTANSRVVGMPVYDTEFVKARLLAAGASQIFTDWRQIDVDSILASS
jgi:beta-phosphoglucomutase